MPQLVSALLRLRGYSVLVRDGSDINGCRELSSRKMNTMPTRIERLRNWLVITAICMLLIVAGFYGYARYRVRKAVRELPPKLGVEVQQSTEGFTYSQSVAGRTIFTIHAARAIRYKGETGRAELKDVNIVVYGRQSNRFDQI